MIDIVVGLQKRPFLGACEATAALANLDLRDYEDYARLVRSEEFCP